MDEQMQILAVEAPEGAFKNLRVVSACGKPYEWPQHEMPMELGDASWLENIYRIIQLDQYQIP